MQFEWKLSNISRKPTYLKAPNRQFFFFYSILFLISSPTSHRNIPKILHYENVSFNSILYQIQFLYWITKTGFSDLKLMRFWKRGHHNFDLYLLKNFRKSKWKSKVYLLNSESNWKSRWFLNEQNSMKLSINKVAGKYNNVFMFNDKYTVIKLLQ